MSSTRLIVEFVLEQSSTLSNVRRIQLYRALSDIVGEDDEARQLSKLADDLESVESSAREFHFQFQQTNLGSSRRKKKSPSM